jgi:hypothetical protein
MTVRSMTTPLGSSSRETLSTFCFANFSNFSDPYPFKILADFKEGLLRLLIPDENGQWKTCLELNRLRNYIGDRTYMTAMGFAGVDIPTQLNLNNLRLFEDRSEKAEQEILQKIVENGKTFLTPRIYSSNSENQT